MSDKPKEPKLLDGIEKHQEFIEKSNFPLEELEQRMYLAYWLSQYYYHEYTRRLKEQ